MKVDTYSTPLAGSADYISTTHDTYEYEGVVLNVYCDQDAKCTIEYSLDGENWDNSYSFDVEASKNKSMHFTNAQRYMRWKVLNATATDMTELRISHKLVAVGRSAPLEHYHEIISNTDLLEDEMTNVVDVSGCNGSITILGSQNHGTGSSGTSSTGALVLQHSYDKTNWYPSNDIFAHVDGDQFSYEIMENLRYLRFVASGGDIIDLTLAIAYKC